MGLQAVVRCSDTLGRFGFSCGGHIQRKYLFRVCRPLEQTHCLSGRQNNKRIPLLEMASAVEAGTPGSCFTTDQGLVTMSAGEFLSCLIKK